MNNYLVEWEDQYGNVHQRIEEGRDEHHACLQVKGGIAKGKWVLGYDYEIMNSKE